MRKGTTSRVLKTSLSENEHRHGDGGTPAIVFNTEEAKSDTFAGMPSEVQMEAFLEPK